MTNQTAPEFETPTRSKRPWFKKKRFLIPAGVLVVAVAFSAGGGGGSEAPVTAAAGESAVAESKTPETKAPKAAKVTVTLDEFNQIKTGMSEQEVETIIGGPGTSESTSDFGAGQMDTLTWNGDGFGDSVMISFQNDKVFSKNQFGLGPS